MAPTKIVRGDAARMKHCLTTLFLGKKVLINALELKHAARTDTNAVLDHKLRQALSVDEYHPLGDPSGEIGCLGREGRRGDEHTLCRPEPDEAACERLNVRPPDGRPWSVSLCLNINTVQAKNIFVDHAVNAAVSGSAKLGRGIPVRATISHGYEEFDDKSLEEIRAILKYSFQKLGP